MAFKNGMVTILIAYFQQFDQGRTVGQFVPANLRLEQGDSIRWECGQFTGTTKVVSVEKEYDNKVWCQLEKIG